MKQYVIYASNMTDIFTFVSDLPEDSIVNFGNMRADWDDKLVEELVIAGVMTDIKPKKMKKLLKKHDGVSVTIAL